MKTNAKERTWIPILRQPDNSNGCAIYGMVNLFGDETLIEKYANEIKNGLSIPDEAEILRQEYGLDFEVLLRSDLRLFEKDIERIIHSANISNDCVLPMALNTKSVKNNHHRIWILVDSNYELKLIDPQRYFVNHLTISKLCEEYEITALIGVYDKSKKSIIELHKDNFKKIFI